MINFENTNTWKFMDEPMRDLMQESFKLLEREKNNSDKWHDYSFVVFPAAKAYEGFLKKLFFNLGFISKLQYVGDRFRIGRALNPNLPKRYQWDWVYDKMKNYCKGDELPLSLWEAWKKGRNQTFHYTAEHKQMIDIKEAEDILKLLIEIMGKALTGCSVVY